MCSLLLKSSPNDAYSSSVTGVCTFANWIASQTLPVNNGYANYDTAANAMTQAKNDTQPWFNQVYPACISIVDQIVAADSQVTPQINLLTTLVAQLQSQPSNQALAQQISQAASVLVGITQKLSQAIQSVQTGLATAGQTANGDQTALNNAISVTNQDVSNLQQLLGQLYGQLHSLQQATCPSKSEIQQCEGQIQSVQSQSDTASELYQILQQALNFVSPAIQGIAYMNNYWIGVLNTATAVVNAMQTVVTAPIVALKIDLNVAQQAWNQMVAAAQATSTTLKAATLAGPATAAAHYATA